MLANRKNAVGETPLHFASKAGHHRCVQLLLQSGAESSETLYGRTPAYFGAAHSHTDVVRELCCHGHVSEEEGKRLLLIATKRNDFATTAVLQRHLNPSLGSNVVQKEQPSSELERERRQKLSEEFRAQALRRPLRRIRHLPDDINAWEPADISKWIQQTGLCDTTTCKDVERKIFSTELTGKIVSSFNAMGLRRIFSIIGIPSSLRIKLAEDLTARQPQCAEAKAKHFAVAVGRNLAWFRFIDVIPAAAMDKLTHIRPAVDVALKRNNAALSSFRFITLSNRIVATKQEPTTPLCELGLFILVSQSVA